MSGLQAPYSIKRLTDVEDSAPGLGAGDSQETRFATGALGSEQIGVTHHRFAAGKRQGVGHRHDEAEEVYVVMRGSGRIKLGDEVVEVVHLNEMDALRLAPEVTRMAEAGPDGLELLAFGPRHKGDAEVVEGFWD